MLLSFTYHMTYSDDGRMVVAKSGGVGTDSAQVGFEFHMRLFPSLTWSSPFALEQETSKSS